MTPLPIFDGAAPAPASHPPSACAGLGRPSCTAAFASTRRPTEEPRRRRTELMRSAKQASAHLAFPPARTRAGALVNAYASYDAMMNTCNFRCQDVSVAAAFPPRVGAQSWHNFDHMQRVDVALRSRAYGVARNCRIGEFLILLAVSRTGRTGADGSWPVDVREGAIALDGRQARRNGWRPAAGRGYHSGGCNP